MEKFSLANLQPKMAKLKLSGIKNDLTLSRFSLRVKIFISEKYGPENVQKIFEEKRLKEISEIAWFMLVEKDLFNNDLNKFLDEICTTEDQLNLITALLESIGIAEPELKEIQKAIDENIPKKKARTGSRRST